MPDKLSSRVVEEWIESRPKPTWEAEDGALWKSFTFPTFRRAIVFVNRVATIADEMDHHPDILVRYTKVRLALSSHDAEGVTMRDLALAERIDFATSAR